MKHSKLYKVLTYVLLFFLTICSNASAYLDPGTGSYFLQIAIAFILGGLYSVKLFWKRIVLFFKKIFAGSKESRHE